MTTPKKDNLNALIFAPLPPPVGGVASITNMLNIGFQKYNDVLFKQPVTKGKLGIYRAASNLVRLIKAVCSIKSKGSVLLFSSAGFSFYEKLIWAKLILLLNRKAVLIMVDGNFPRFYQSLSVKYRRVISKQISHKNITIGAQSDTWLKYYKEIFPLANIEVVSASVDRTFMEVTRPSREKTSKIKLLYIGWIIPEKGIVDLLDAMKIINSANTNVSLSLIGPLFNKEQYWSDELLNRGIAHNVEFVGPIHDRKVMIEKLVESDIFVFPSHFEGFPVSVIEAISIGLPCVATKVGGIPDILGEGKAGILVDVKSPQQLADGVLKLAADTALRNSLGNHAHERARKEYSFDNLIKTYRNILKIEV